MKTFKMCKATKCKKPNSFVKTAGCGKTNLTKKQQVQTKLHVFFAKTENLYENTLPEYTGPKCMHKRK
jgi:hypothetical protein